MSLAALIIAVVAMVISICGFVWSVVWSIYQHRQVTRGRLYVRASFGTIVGAAGPGHPVISVTATNAGVVPVTVNSAMGDVKGAKLHLELISWLLQTPRPLPVKLDPGETWTGYLDPHVVQTAAANIAQGRSTLRLTISVRDGVDRVHKAKALTL